MSDLIHGYSSAEFERQYNARLWSENSEHFVEQNEKRSAAYRKEARLLPDLAFGPLASNTIDFFYATEGEVRPIIVFIHGGYWRSRDKHAFSFLAKPFNEAGFNVAVTNYSLCPNVSLTTIVEEMRLLCEWIFANPEVHGGRHDALYVMGHSAGAHLGAMLAATDWSARPTGLPEDFIRAVVPVSGIFELEPLVAHSVNNDLHLSPSEVEQLSPIRLRPAVLNTKMDVFVGASESDAFRAQSRQFSDTWRASGLDLTFTEIEGLDHYSILSAIEDPQFVITRRLIDRVFRLA